MGTKKRTIPIISPFFIVLINFFIKLISREVILKMTDLPQQLKVLNLNKEYLKIH